MSNTLSPTPTSNSATTTTCCIAGGGPAGVICGFLLARSGVDVIVLEKHADFFRDFRGDTIHPSTLELMYELGILKDFLTRHHQELRQIGAVIDDLSAPIANFVHVPTHCKFIALMPQWDFLDFITEKAKAYPQFHLLMEHEVTDLIVENDRVAGVRVKTPQGPKEFRATLTIGADGRHSIVRQKANLEVIDLGAPIDVLWMRISRQSSDPEQTLGRFHSGTLLVMINRDDYWQIAYIIHKGGFPAIQQKGLPAFRQSLETAAPFLKGRTAELKDWKDVSLLSVAVDRLRHWFRRGLLCIGDSAHAMSPVGGVGINLAIQDAVAAANILAPVFARQANVDVHLHELQDRRMFPTRVTQAFQVFAHKRAINVALNNKAPVKTLPLPFRLLKSFPFLQRIPARLVGVGVRPEHIHTRDIHAPAPIPQPASHLPAAPDTEPRVTLDIHPATRPGSVQAHSASDSRSATNRH
jgi:2-polyprenyl-6-methoxyphenol hydroxylase-like FAD-dependent oxidoreductase